MLAAPPPLWKKASAISQRPLQGEKWLIPNKSGAIWRINPSTSATQQHTDGFKTLLHCYCLISTCISYYFPWHPVKCHSVTRRRGSERASRRWTHVSTCKSPHLPPFYTNCSESSQAPFFLCIRHASCMILLTQSGKVCRSLRALSHVDPHLLLTALSSKKRNTGI